MPWVLVTKVLLQFRTENMDGALISPFLLRKGSTAFLPLFWTCEFCVSVLCVYASAWPRAAAGAAAAWSADAVGRRRSGHGRFAQRARSQGRVLWRRRGGGRSALRAPRSSLGAQQPLVAPALASDAATHLVNRLFKPIAMAAATPRA